MSQTVLDPITFEILQHRLWQVAQEMAISLSRVTGSPVTIDAKDFMVGLFDGEGNLITSGAGVLYHGYAFQFGIRHIIETYGDDPGINEGDVFFLNDPYISSLHKQDAAVLTPIHFKGARIGWASTMTHLVDIGGTGIGGKSIQVRHIIQEGFNFRGIKIAERGTVRKDVFDSIISMSRDPGMVGLDIRGELAAGEVARKRVSEIVEEHGLEVYHALCREIINHSETRFRARLREIPDGAWRARLYIDADGVTNRIYKVDLTLTKRGEHLFFDFSGTDAAAPTYINCTTVGAKAAVFAAIGPLLAYDIPWNQGIANCYDVELPEASVISARSPSPCGSATIGAAEYAFGATVHAISKMLYSSSQHREDATGVWGLAGGTTFFAAETQKRVSAVIAIMDVEALGGGARTYADGVDTAGHFLVPEGSIANVEVYEERYPLLYLFRRQRIDSGGAGMFRGGTAIEGAMTLHGSPTGKADAVHYGSGVEVPVSCGLSGGYPGGSLLRKLVKRSDIDRRFAQGKPPQRLEDLEGNIEELSAHGNFEFSNGDVYYYGHSGGGGYGDPIERETSSVAKDVKSGLVSLGSASQTYGVILQPDTLEVDVQRTKEKRDEMKQFRAEATETPADIRDIAAYLETGLDSGKQVIKCLQCGCLMRFTPDSLKLFCLSNYRALREVSPAYSGSERFVLQEFYCPDCATLFDVEVVVKGLK